MTKTRIVEFRVVMYALLIGAVAMAPLEIAGAWQSSPRPVVIAPSPSAQAQQNVQQQQANNRLQQSQLQQQLHQSVSDTARKPNASDAQAQQQADQADQARRERDQAADQDMIDRQRDQNQLPRVVPNQPASTRSSG